MLAVKRQLPITAAEIHKFLKKINEEVVEKIGPASVSMTQSFWPDEQAQPMLVRFEIPKFVGHRFRDANGNFVRKLDGFALTISHYVLDDTESPGHEHECWYVLPFATAERRDAAGGSYSSAPFLPACDTTGKDLEEMDFSPVVDYLASLVQDDVKKRK